MSSGGRASESRHGDWAQLPDGLLDDIIRRFNTLNDIIHFQVVCKPWRQATLAAETPKLRQSLPWLMRPCEESSSSSHGPSCRRFIDLTSAMAGGNNAGVAGHINVPGDDPSTSGRISSTFGWLLRATEQQHNLFLFKPCTGNQIPLPELMQGGGGGGDQYSERRYNVVTLAMSADPTSKGCIVMICYFIKSSDGSRHGLAFCEIGDRQWRLVPLPTEKEQIAVQAVSDIVYCRGEFHALCRSGDILVCRTSGVSRAFRSSNGDRVVYLIKRLYEYDIKHCYLSVSPEDELMVVVRSFNNDKEMKIFSGIHRFKVYRIDGETMAWSEVVDIGDYALFQSNYKVAYVSVEDHPGCQANCVYNQVGMFNLGTRRNELNFDFTNDDRGWTVSAADAVWIFPSNY